MRGKRCGVAAAVVTYRIIPAHAGQTKGATCYEMCKTDHPRACGANLADIDKAYDVNGSSPRMRGKQNNAYVTFSAQRIIPAHAGQTFGSQSRIGTMPDHPRACGANGIIHGRNHADAGSSPRMRGKPIRSGEFFYHSRIIPAHAGQTRSSHPIRQYRSDYPRACGANDSLYHRLDFAHGSSPRMRGKLHGPRDGGRRLRIIPAHAGQTTSASRHHRPITDHPRACGANSTPTTRPPNSVGSSPRMRGKLQAGHRQHDTVRIIPAHAGQTCRGRRIPGRRPDHPRACGANDIPHAGRIVGVGSSPRMRGKPRLCGVYPVAVRIIPAHAGQTVTCLKPACKGTDHPRACGANFFRCCFCPLFFGSSPRMRGKRRSEQPWRRSFRIIPAHAGQTCCMSALIWRCPDHPRACGANSVLLVCHGLGSGSSPRMRGKHGHGPDRWARKRIIPAHAGQTRPQPPRHPVSTDHPRACGANFYRRLLASFRHGSSPRMRGKHTHRRAPSGGTRIIPAHAGQTP